MREINERPNPAKDLIYAELKFDLLGYDENLNEGDVRQELVDAVRRVRALSDRYPSLGGAARDKITAGKLRRLGVDPESLELLDGALQQPVDSDIT